MSAQVHQAAMRRRRAAARHSRGWVDAAATPRHDVEVEGDVLELLLCPFRATPYPQTGTSYFEWTLLEEAITVARVI